MTSAEKQVLAEPKTEKTGGSIAAFLRLIRFSHTIFALPFALASLIVAAGGRPSGRVLLMVLLCMVCARTAAMLFNRLVDWNIDQRNPRTALRHLLASRPTIIIALVVSSGAFLGFTALINNVAFALSPVALAIVFFYSITKRFTAITHFFLGLALGIAPIGAWIAQTGRIAIAPLILALAVICWVSGFDLIYATQDYDFDRREGLHSLVIRLGVGKSLRLAQFLHLAMFAGLIAFGIAAELGPIYFSAMIPIAAGLWYEHRSAQRLDIAGINRAFFQSNAFISGVFVVAVWLDRVV